MEEYGVVCAADPVLGPFLTACGDREADYELERLIWGHARPVVREIIGHGWRKSGGSINPAFESTDEHDAEDVAGEAIVRVVARVREVRAHPEWEPIRDFAAYTAVTARHAFHAHLRRKNPARCSLKSRVRYALNQAPGLAIWPSGDGWACGLAKWIGDAPCHSERLAEIQRRPEAFLDLAQAGRDASAADLTEIVGAVLQDLDAPVDFEALVATLSEVTGIRSLVVAATCDETGEDLCERVADTTVDVHTEVSDRIYLERLWREIRELPANQRAALLLNLRDADGRGVIALFPIRGIAPMSEIAEALGLPLERLVEMWDELPLDDCAIAAILGVTRQQVINLRKCARERLSRRMRDMEA